MDGQPQLAHGPVSDADVQALGPRRFRAAAAGAVFIYALLGLAAAWPILPGQSNRIPDCACGDPGLQVWLLRWVPYALAHGHNPLFTNFTNYPHGVNLAQNTDMPLLALLTAPLTVFVSPVASYNLLLWLAFPVSAGAMFIVLRSWTGSNISAFVGGLLYGFSAYMLAEGSVHVMLSFVPLPPLFFFQAHKLIVRQNGNPYKQGLLLGLIAVLQFYISAEILATMAVIALVGVLILTLAASNRTRITGPSLAYALRGLTCCAGLVVVLIGYPVWFMEFGPQHYRGPVQPVDNPYRSDLLGPILPTRAERFVPAGLLGIGDKLVAGNNTENGSYLGLPLLLLTTLLSWRFRKNRWILFSVTVAAVAFVLSLGPRLVVDARLTPAPLPFSLLAGLPLLNNVIPARLSLFAIMFVAIAVALGVAEIRMSGRHNRWRNLGPWRRPPASVSIVGCLGLLSVLSLFPRWPAQVTASTTPALFRSPEGKAIPAGSVVLTYPFPDYPYDQPMIWQAVEGMRFREMGTYAQVPDAQGTVADDSTGQMPSSVQEFLIAQEDGAPEVAADGPLVRDVHQYLVTYDVSTVIVTRSQFGGAAYGYVPGHSGRDGRAEVEELFSEAIGPPRIMDGAAVWFDVATRLH